MNNDIATIDAPAVPSIEQQSISSNALILSDQNLDRAMKMAEIMAKGRVTVPKHLQGSAGDCLAIVMQAMQWGMNSYAVAQKTHLVNGTLGYEAQLIIAVLNNSPLLETRLRFEWGGDWKGVNGKSDKSETRTVTATAKLRGDPDPVSLTISMSQAGVRNSPLWEQDPRQQLAYLCAKRWARLYCPDVILGVYTPDELEQPAERDMGAAEVVETPPANTRTQSLKDRLGAGKKAQADEKPAEPTVKLSDVLQSIEAAQDADSLTDAAADAAKLSDADKAKARKAYAARAEQIAAAKAPTTDPETGEILDAETDDWVGDYDAAEAGQGH